MIDVFSLVGTVSIQWSQAAKGLEELSEKLSQTAAALYETEQATDALNTRLLSLGENTGELTALLDKESQSLLQGLEGTLSRLQSLWSSGWNELLLQLSDALSGMNSTLQGGLSLGESNTLTALSGISQGVSGTLAGIQTAVADTIARVQESLDFSWSLPSLKLPHISVSGSFSLNPPSVPSFSISWYKKAMEEGMILNSPTIFGMQGNRLLAGGEAGSETVIGTERLLELIQQASGQGETVQVLEEGFEKLLALLGEYLPQTANTQLLLDGKSLVGELAPMLDKQLGRYL